MSRAGATTQGERPFVGVKRSPAVRGSLPISPKWMQCLCQPLAAGNRILTPWRGRGVANPGRGTRVGPVTARVDRADDPDQEVLAPGSCSIRVLRGSTAPGFAPWAMAHTRQLTIYGKRPFNGRNDRGRTLTISALLEVINLRWWPWVSGRTDS